MTIDHGFHATMTAQPGMGDEVVALLLDAPALTHPDCVVFLVGRSAGDPDVVHLTEGWTSRAAHAEFFTTAPARDLVTRLEPLLAAEATYTDEVPVGGRAAL
ncbi:MULTISPECIES: putative quinol monooxygenase [unclassified Micromonospora]|uniref:putative quinol monooxygenase n=1 Tax=unclassified Micromonospora TaxID=2617518 RepID=UPI001033CD8A|nr:MULTISPECIES: antibiotic biosynthesis monooxygenase [unclassified Micromonospora]QKW14228.1 antibiotic biosynthesis monooxygenase [Verrucosispora sp. NA02020]TBL31311.1 antibiotic biosynthesis monooxygenase [Verrucosispora sp. SN26_14.1]